MTHFVSPVSGSSAQYWPLFCPAPTYSILASGTARREGEIYGFDKPNARIIALSKVDGSFRAQYRLAVGNKDWSGLPLDWSGLRAMYAIPGADGQPATLFWMSENSVYQAPLMAVPDAAPTASPASSANPSGSAGPTQATPKPTKKP